MKEFDDDLTYLIYQFVHEIDFLNINNYKFEQPKSGYAGNFESHVRLFPSNLGCFSSSLPFHHTK